MINYDKSLEDLYLRKFGQSNSGRTSDGMSVYNESIKSDSAGIYKSFSNRDFNKKNLNYIREAMEEVPDRSTKISIEEGKKIISHLDKVLGTTVTYKFQGSVPNNTHIRQHSDIDILVIIEKFYSLEPPQKAENPYQGNPNQDMAELRQDCFDILSNIFKKDDSTKVDNSGSKSIYLSGGNLRRKIDVVPANWYDSNDYTTTRESYYRGVQVYDKSKNERIPNFPFLTNHRIEQKDQMSYGNYRRMVRLAKNLREDSDSTILKKLSSYDIQAIFYHMPRDYFYSEDPFESIYFSAIYLCELLEGKHQFNNLLVIDETRKISDKVTWDILKALLDEFFQISNDLKMTA